MRQFKTWLVVCATALVVVAVPPQAAAQASLAAARDLYGSAAYTEALTMFNGLSATERGRERQTVDLYRALCLVALGRKAEADTVIDAMVAQEPFYRPAADVPPRMRAAFSDARKRLLPSLLQQTYTHAKSAFNKKDYPSAARGFQQVLEGLADPDIASISAQPPLADLRTLAEGFYDLSAKASAPAAPAPARAAVAAPDPSRIYGPQDTNVAPPVTIRQRVPPITGRVPTSGNAVVEVVIDTLGSVESARMAVSLNGPFDQAVLVAARHWQYQPATLNGVPVKYRKPVRVSLAPPPR